MSSFEETDVFINCPFDPDYNRLFRAVVFSIHACGFRARCVKEIPDSGEVRINKLAEMISNCKYSFHDLTRVGLDPKNKLPRFNMPFELGLFLGAKYFLNGKQRKKRQAIIFESKKYDLQKCLSDLAGNDPKMYGNDHGKLIEELRNWLSSLDESKGKVISGPKKIISKFKDFEYGYPELCRRSGFEKEGVPFPDFSKMVAVWLEDDLSRA